MGHLISRAYKRITQCGQPRAQPANQQSGETATQASATHQVSTAHQSIPVGQSIDSAEYAAFNSNNKRSKQQEQQQQPSPNDTTTQSSSTVGSKQDVEGAVIKIQALVRGHLARKALKDSSQNSNAQLGQSQFDEESLTRGQPSAVFTSPLHNNGDFHQQVTSNANNKTTGNLGISEQQQQPKTPLESIAEDSESLAHTNQSSSQQQPQLSLEDSGGQEASLRMASLCARSSATSPDLEPARPKSPRNLSRGSLSPALSETGASIDLDCTGGGSFSASIDIADHKPAYNMAAVLHPQDGVDTLNAAPMDRLSLPGEEDGEPMNRVDNENDEGVDVGSPPPITTTDNGLSQQLNEQVGTPDSLGSEEVAAIRIQSAFRGYRTRKNSPYRSRSPNNQQQMSNGEQVVALGQRQEAIMLADDDELLSPEDQFVAESSVQLDERRASRTRRRDEQMLLPVSSNGETQMEEQSDKSLEELTADEDVSTVKELPRDHPVSFSEESSSHRLASEDSDTKLLEAERNSQNLSLMEETLSSSEATANQHQLSAALEVTPTTGNEGGGGEPLAKALKTSEAGSMDTDSSYLGGALSFNETEEVSSSLVDSLQPSMLTTSTNLDQTVASIEAALAAVENDDSKASEVLEMLDETLDTINLKDYTLDEAIEKLGQLDEEVNKTIEMESDDIEKRDPKGEVSEERAKSPQIRMSEQAPNLLQEQQDADDGGQLVVAEEPEVEVENASSALLNAEKTTSGHSTPALNSSEASSGSSSEAEPGSEGATSAKQKQETTTKHNGSAKGAKRRNRKKRSKK